MLLRAGQGHPPAAPLAALYNTEGALLLTVGRARDALPFIQRSVGMDPLSAVKAARLLEAYAMVGDIGTAHETSRARAGPLAHPCRPSARPGCAWPASMVSRGGANLAGDAGQPAGRPLAGGPRCVARLPGRGHPRDDMQAARRWRMRRTVAPSTWRPRF